MFNSKLLKKADVLDKSVMKHFFTEVGECIKEITGKEVVFRNLYTENERRIAQYVVANVALDIIQSWQSDGSPDKPVTKILWNNEISINVGRMAIWWTNPRYYAEDIVNNINEHTAVLNYETDDDK